MTQTSRPNPPFSDPLGVTLSIVIVNWNAVRYLSNCLATLRRFLSPLSPEIIVIDNASYDGSKELIQRDFPEVHFIQSEANLGFARANNIAVRRSAGEYVLLLNPDTELVDDSLLRMLQYLRENSHVGAVGCRLLNSDLSLQWKYVQSFPTILNQLLTADLLQRTFPRWKLWGLRPLFDCVDGAVDVEVLAGSCVMLRRTAFEAVGLFSEEYFMYADDVDLCYKIRRSGYLVKYFGSATLIHHGGTSSAFRKENHFATVMQQESRLKFFSKTRGASYARAYRCVMGCAAVLRIIVIACMLPLSSIIVGRTGLQNAAAKWRSILRWAVGKEKWASTVGST